MAATNIMTTASGAAHSADVVVSAPLIVGLKGFTNDAAVTVALKDDVGAYNEIGRLVAEDPARLLVGPGTYRFSRTAGTCGVFSG